MGSDDLALDPRVGILGAGTMGAGIALTALRAGMHATLCDVDELALERARAYLVKYLSGGDRDPSLERFSVVSQLKDLEGLPVVIEAVPENLDLKQKVFRGLDRSCPPPTVLATNTSTLSVTAIASVCDSPERVGGMHFFNPAPVLPLVEVVQAAQTSPQTLATIVHLAEALGKTPVVTQDTPGFIVNRVARPFYGEALRLLGEGVAGHSEIDRVVRAGCGFRMGPFELMDLIGIDINLAATISMYEQTFGEPRYRPHRIQQQMVLRNALGRKTGNGFYVYPRAKEDREEKAPVRAAGRSGLVLLSKGSWAPGLAEAILEAGYTLSETHGEIPRLAAVVAGRGEGLRDHVRRFDGGLAPDIPLLCQAADATVGEIASWMKHPERLVGFDGLFFGRGVITTLVASPGLPDNLRIAVEGFFGDLGRNPVWIEDSPGLILPRIIGMIANEAAFAVAEGVADPTTIDRAMKLGADYPVGPLEGAEELGHTRVVEVIEHLYARFGEERYRTAPLLKRLAERDQRTGPSAASLPHKIPGERG